MSDVGDAAGQPGYRIGDTERAAATDALNAHLAAGRLDATEYEDRQVQVSRARTWADIQPVFGDLPQPHPAGMPALDGAPANASGAPAAHPAGVVDVPAAPLPQGPLGGLVPEQYRSSVMALTPFAALLLFIVTWEWWWFLAIPVMGILLYGPDGDDHRRWQHRNARAERRRIERGRRRGY
jgi:Domain of unknown function (DUF1707)